MIRSIAINCVIPAGTQISPASDGSGCFIFYPPDEDGIRKGERYRYETTHATLIATGYYRLAADGSTWDRIADHPLNTPF